MRCPGVPPAMPGDGKQDFRGGVFDGNTDYNSAHDLSRSDGRRAPSQPHPLHADRHEESLAMDDVTRSAETVPAGAPKAPPRLDFQDHLADLEARGLLVRIDHPVNKDTELHPLVRLQFIGGIPEAERRAFLFTNVIDGSGRRYDIPVVVGAIAASAEIYSLGMRREVQDIGKAWMEAIAKPIPPVRVSSPRCQEVVITGEALRAPDGGLKVLPVPMSTPGFDSAPYLTATL